MDVMDDALKGFLVELVTDPRKLAEFQKDRESYLAASKLSLDARRAVLSGDQARVASLIGEGGRARRPPIKQYIQHMAKQYKRLARKKKKAGGKKAGKKKAASKKRAVKKTATKK